MTATPKISPEAYREACDLVAQCYVDVTVCVPLMAELVALRRLHREVARLRSSHSLGLLRLRESLPTVADVAAWRRAVSNARDAWEASQPGAQDLVQKARTA